MNVRLAIVIFLTVLLFTPVASSQSISIEAFGGYANIGELGSSEDPQYQWGPGWKIHGGIEVKLLPFLAVTGHFGNYRLSYQGAGEVGGSLQSSRGDPMNISEIAFGLRFHTGPVFFTLRRSAVTFNYGETSFTYVPVGQSAPLTSTRKLPAKSKSATGLGIGIQYELTSGLSVIPEVNVAVVRLMRGPYLTSVGIGVRYELARAGI